MTKCPLTATQHGSHSYCMENGCTLWDNGCLIATALKTYIEKNTPITSYTDDFLTAMNFGILPSNEGDIL